MYIYIMYVYIVKYRHELLDGDQSLPEKYDEQRRRDEK